MVPVIGSLSRSTLRDGRAPATLCATASPAHVGTLGLVNNPARARRPPIGFDRAAGRRPGCPGTGRRATTHGGGCRPALGHCRDGVHRGVRPGGAVPGAWCYRRAGRGARPRREKARWLPRQPAAAVLAAGVGGAALPGRECVRFRWPDGRLVPAGRRRRCADHAGRPRRSTRTAATVVAFPGSWRWPRSGHRVDDHRGGG